MSRLLCRNKSIELLEPYEGKLSRTVLRGERGSNVPDLPDFIKERYKPELQKDDMSFLSRSFERHFNERPYLKHSCYLYLTKTTKERNRMQSNFSTLCRGHIIPKELDKETAGKFMEAAEQFERIMNDSGFVRLRRLSTDELVGTEKSAGLIERYFSLMPEGDTRICPERWRLTSATRNSPRIEATAASPLPLPWGCCSLATTSTTSM